MARSSSVTFRCRFISSPIRSISTSCSRRSTSPQRWKADPVPQPPAKRFTDIPGPLALPMLRHSAHVLPRIGNIHHQVGLGLLEGLRDRYGDLVRLAKGSRKRPVLYIFDPQLMREVYDSGATKAPYWDHSPLQKQRQLKNSHCTVNGKETENIWPSLRAVLQDGSFLTNYNKALDNIACDATRRLGDLRHAENLLNEEVETEVYRWALESLGMVIIGRRLGCLDGAVDVHKTDNSKLKNTSLEDMPSEQCSLARRSLEECTPAEKLVRSSMEIAERSFLVRSEHTLKKDSEVFNAAVEAFDQHYCLVDHFLSQTLKDIDSGQDQPEMVLLKNLRPLNSILLPLAADTLLAGVDLLSHTALSMLYHFSLHPARQQRVHDEISWKTAADDAGAERPTELPYIAACAREALRLHPATGAVVRRTMEDIVVGGYDVPEGVDIVLAHGVSSRTEGQFGRAKTFVPERYHSQGWETSPALKSHPIASRPFGTTCPASAMVGRMLTSFASNVLEKYRLEWHGPAPNLANSGVNRLQPPYYFVLQNA